MSKNIEEKIALVASIAKKVHATPESLEKLLDSNLLRDLLNPDAIVRNISRDAFRLTLELPELIHVDYSLTLAEMLDQSQIQDVDPNILKVDPKCVQYKYSAQKTFECEDVVFGGPTLTKNARDVIIGSDGSWQQLDLPQILVYRLKHPEKQVHHPIVCGQVLEIKGVHHIAVLGCERRRMFIQLIPSKQLPAWPKITIFPKARLAI